MNISFQTLTLMLSVSTSYRPASRSYVRTGTAPSRRRYQAKYQRFLLKHIKKAFSMAGRQASFSNWRPASPDGAPPSTVKLAVAGRSKASKEIIESLSHFGDCALEEASVIDFLQREGAGGLLVENLHPFNLREERPNNQSIPLIGRVNPKRCVGVS